MLPAFLVGCGAAHVTVGPAAPTVAVIASPASINAGSSSTLTVTATNATQVKISGSDGSAFTLLANGGSQAVSPSATTTYTATAIGDGGQVSATAVVTVVPPQSPSVNITASPASIGAGASSTLTVTATNATLVTIAGSDGSAYTLPANGGSQAVTPAVTATYTATATGPGGTTTATATITVTPNPAPTVTIIANPASIVSGASSTLTVTATNATQVTIAGTDGSAYNLTANGGIQAVTPAVTTSYTVTAKGLGGQVSATAVVTVVLLQPPTVSITASPASISAGNSSTLTVTATNATQVTIAGSDGSAYTLSATGGTQAVSPTATTTYTATATGPGGKISATATVTVTPNPAPTVTITANPAWITSGNASTLTVTATNATQVTIAGTNGSAYTLSATGGTQAVSPTATTTYTATATGPGGKISATTAVTVTPNPTPTVTITANPATITSGNASTLTATATNATQVTIAGSDGSAYTLSATGGTQAVSPAATTTYTVTAIGPGGTTTAATTVTVIPAPVVTLVANPTTVVSGSPSTLTVTATNATQVILTGTDGSSYTLQPSGGTQSVSPAATTTYTATATGAGGSTTATAVVTVIPQGSIQSINHVIFLQQENHSFDNYFGMLNPYRKTNGWNIGDDGKDYEVDGIDDKLTKISNLSDENAAYQLFKLTSSCVQDMSSDWLASFGDVNRYNFLTTRNILMDGFVHNAEGFAKSCAAPGSGGSCSGIFPDLTGRVSMGYYDQDFLNYYYYMASQFALSDRWFSPVATKSVGNRIATFTGGTTQGLVKDPGDDHLSQLVIPNIFQELDQAKVSWRIYFTSTQGFCLSPDSCPPTGNARYPATFFSTLAYSFQYLYQNSSGAPCVAPTQPSSVVGDSTNSYCIDPTHIAPLSTYFTDVTNSTLPSFAFIEAGYGNNDEHPGSGQSVLVGQEAAAKIVNSLMVSPSWKDSAFFFTFDEGGGPYDHVPPVPGHSNDNTATSLGAIPDVSQISVNADSYKACVPVGGVPTTHCDLVSTDPGANSADAAAVDGFAAQIGFRLPNFIVSPFTRKHFVSHIPMDHTAVIKFVENRFIGPSAHLTARDSAQPNLLDFFDFNTTPWSTPPTPPTPVTATSLGHDPCDPTKLGP